MYSLNAERLSWWSMNSVPQDSYSFSRKEASLFINLNVVFHVILFWPLSLFIIYSCVFYREVYLQIFPNAFILFLIFFSFIILCMSCADMRYRWLLYRHSEAIALSIDVKRQILTYTQNHKITEFSFVDIERWYGTEYKFDRWNVCAEILEIRLRTGQKIIVSNGIGPVVDFFRENWKELGIPKGERSTKSLRFYVKEIKKQQ